MWSLASVTWAYSGILHWLPLPTLYNSDVFEEVLHGFRKMNLNQGGLPCSGLLAAPTGKGNKNDPWLVLDTAPRQRLLQLHEPPRP